MATNMMTGPLRTSLPWPAVFRAARLAIFGFMGWLWFFSADKQTRSGAILHD
jgi:hypothetical protein